MSAACSELSSPTTSINLSPTSKQNHHTIELNYSAVETLYGITRAVCTQFELQDNPALYGNAKVNGGHAARRELMVTVTPTGS